MIQRYSLIETCLKICKTNKTWETTELRIRQGPGERGDGRGVTKRADDNR